MQVMLPNPSILHACSRFAIVQVNYNLLTVNVFMAITGMYQLSRKIGAGSPDAVVAATHPTDSQLIAASGSGPQVPPQMQTNKE